MPVVFSGWGWIALAAAFLPGVAAAAIAAGSADDQPLSSGEQYAILCNSCTTPAEFIDKALAAYPRAGDSVAYVYNLATGQVRGVLLDWDPEFRVQDGGREIPLEPGLATYVRQAGEMYRRNGNSLEFAFIFRADGSAYWKPATGAAVELCGAGLDIAWMGGVQADDPRFDPRSNPAPGAGSPVDARGYEFPANFTTTFPNYPDSSYDLGFGLAGAVDEFVRHVAGQLRGGAVSDVFNGTVTGGNGVSMPLLLIAGGASISRQVRSPTAIYIPMKDGGFARVGLDVRAGEVSLKELQDSAGFSLPPADTTTPAQHLSGREFHFAGSPRGDQSLDAFTRWAARNSIVVRGASLGRGGSVRCSSSRSNQVTCTFHPT